MQRVHRSDLEGIVTLISKQTSNRHRFALGRAYGGYRLERCEGSIDVSPRLKAGQMYTWLHAFKDGLLLGAEHSIQMEND